MDIDMMILSDEASSPEVFTPSSSCCEDITPMATDDINQLNRKDDSGNESLESAEDSVARGSVKVVKIPALDKYNLRLKSIQKRIEVENKRKNPRKEPRPKQRPPPLSKYRRKNANARERNRMQEINEAFKELKKAVPHLASDFEEGQDQNSKLTKITTLRLAVNYIAVLTMILDQTEPPISSPSSSQAT